MKYGRNMDAFVRFPGINAATLKSYLSRKSDVSRVVQVSGVQVSGVLKQ